MKRFLIFTVVAVVALGAGSGFAGEGCCGGMSKSSAKGASCGDMFSKLNLTDDQKAKIEILKQSCLKATSTSEFHVMFNSGLEKIFTPDQLSQWDAHSGRALKAGSCPLMNSDSGKTGKQT
jgi:hypothetical protein